MVSRDYKGKSIIEFPSEYVCIDVETTGLDFSSDEIIEVAASRVKDNQIIDTFTSLIRPRVSHVLLPISEFKKMTDSDIDRFFESHLVPDFITELTGITNDMLLSSDTDEVVLPKLNAFVGDSIVVGHNVNFDVNFLYDAFGRQGIIFSNNYVDTLRIARKLFPELPHHRLQDLSAHLGILQDAKHRAGADVETTVQCFVRMSEIIRDTEGVDAFKGRFGNKTSNYSNKLKNLIAISTEIDDTNPIFGKVVVFTGALSTMSRKDAFQIVCNLGGIPDLNLTQRTNFLVIGKEDFAKSVKDGKTSKMKKADAYRKKGLDIISISEDTFFQMIGYNTEV